MTTEIKRVPKAVLYVVTAFMVFATIYSLGIRIDIFTTAFDMIQEKFSFLYLYGILVAGGGCIGLMMIIVCRKKLIKTDVILIALLLVALIISAFMNSDMGLKENLSGVVTIGVTVVTFYLIGKSFSKQDIHFCLVRVILWASLIWNYGCAVSLAMYMACHSGYYKFGGFIRFSRMGLMDGRLFGCFSDPNYAAMIAVLISGGLIYIYRKHGREFGKTEGKKPVWLIAERIYIYLSLELYLFYVVLAQSRSTEIAVISAGILFVILLTYRARKQTKQEGIFRAYGVKIILMLVIMVAVYFGVMYGLQGIGTILVPERNVEMELVRDDVSIENISNSRFEIWTDYLMLVKDRPVFGLSTRGALTYAKKVDPTGYLAEREYNPHSVFVLSAVQGGIVGFFLVLLFILRATKRTWKRCINEKGLSRVFLLSLFFVVIYGIYCVFNVGFFVTTCFEAMLAWIGLGYLEQSCERTIDIKE